MEFNKFIDFAGIFKELTFEHEQELIHYRYEAEHYNDLLNFLEHHKANHELLIGECEFCDETISFVFGMDFHDANENSGQSSWSTYFILYNRRLHEFTICEQEQG